MPVQQTSVEAYNEAMDSGLIKNIAANVFAIILEYGPLTQAMGRERYCQLFSERSIRAVGPRFTELKDMGVIVPSHTEECQITGRNAIHWKVATSCGEIKRPTKKITNKEAVKKLLLCMYKIEAMVKDSESECTRSNIIKIIDDCLGSGEIA